MEEVREEKRAELTDIRHNKRSLLQDRARRLDKAQYVGDVHTESEMKSCAKRLGNKSQITPELLIAIKNGLLANKNNVDAFLKVDIALPSLLRLLSSTAADARLQVLAAHCVCNLALGDDRVCVRVAKAAGSYLVMRMEGMNSLLKEASVWAVGNMSSSRKASTILQAEGAYLHAARLLSSSAADSATKSAAAYCLVQVMYHNHSIFSNEEYEFFTTTCLDYTEPDAMVLLLCSLLSNNPNAMALMAKRELHIEAINRLEQVSIEPDDVTDVTTPLALIRILGNLATEPTGYVAKRILQSSSFPKVARRFLIHEQSAIPQETAWLLANLAEHNNFEIRALCETLGLMSWFPENFNL